jgi:sialate O-acetylesterase
MMKAMNTMILSAWVAITLNVGSVLAADPATPVALKLAPIFSDHMVLQRDLPVPIWGTAKPGEKITVTFRDQKVSTVAGTNGQWRVTLKAMQAVTDPQELVVTGDTMVTIKDVLVGEVWLGAGQSNMVGVGGFTPDDPVLLELATKPYPQIRFRGRDGWGALQPRPNVSALMYAFAIQLQKELDVPVGVMVVAKNGVAAAIFLGSSMIKDYPPAYEKWVKAYNYEQRVEQYPILLARWEEDAKKAREAGKPEPANKPQPLVKPEDYVHEDQRLHKEGIAPLMGYALRGMVWDQGEGGSGALGLDWYDVMGVLINGWRKGWGIGEFPFIYVQKPSGGGCAWDTNNVVTAKAEAFAPLPEKVPDDGAGVEAFLKAMSYPNTAMAISSDLGSGIHPVNKSGYGARVATVALGLAYGQKIEYYGPVYASHEMEGQKVRIKFTHVGQGLAARHADKLQGFAVAGADKVFHWADAVIDPSTGSPQAGSGQAADTVVVSSAAVPQPVAVRYAWSVNRPWANLFNKDGLPAQPFRTDAWEK